MPCQRYKQTQQEYVCLTHVMHENISPNRNLPPLVLGSAASESWDTSVEHDLPLRPWQQWPILILRPSWTLKIYWSFVGWNHPICGPDRFEPYPLYNTSNTSPKNLQYLKPFPKPRCRLCLQIDHQVAQVGFNQHRHGFFFGASLEIEQLGALPRPICQLTGVLSSAAWYVGSCNISGSPHCPKCWLYHFSSGTCFASEAMLNLWSTWMLHSPTPSLSESKPLCTCDEGV